MTLLRTLCLLSLPFLMLGCVELELSTSSLELINSQETTLTADQPGNVTSSSDLVTTVWTSSDESVVIVTADSIDPRTATVVAVGAGEATIEVAEGGTPSVCDVTVLPGALLTIAVDADAFQLIEPKLDDTRLGEEGYSALLDEYAYFLDTGDSETLLVEAGERDLTFQTPTSFVLDGTRYRLADPIVVEDGVDQTVVFEGLDGEYEEVP
jgi:hypothetical protein